jgi:hypothetical protein
MSAKELIRLDALGRVKRKELAMLAAAELMGLSLRQARRLWKRFKAVGNGGVVHQLRGRSSNRRLSADVRETVGQDWCVRWNNRWLQIGPEHESMQLARRKVRVRELSDGTLLLDYQGQRLSVTELSARPTPPKARKTILNNRRYKPAASHPWKSEPTVGPHPPVKSAPAAPART